MHALSVTQKKFARVDPIDLFPLPDQYADLKVVGKVDKKL